MSLRGTSPIVPVRDIAASARFYTEVLGFEQVIDNAAYGYACFRFGEALVAVTQTDDEGPLKATRENISAQIWVESVDALFDQWKDALATLPDGRVNGPLDQAYGTRELHIKCPDGFLMFFTQDDSLES